MGEQNSWKTLTRIHLTTCACHALQLSLATIAYITSEPVTCNVVEQISSATEVTYIGLT